MTPRTLLVFTKNPILGAVKTRLARTIGNEAALHIYSLLLEDAQKRYALAQCFRQVWYGDFVPEADGWDPTIFTKKLQPQGDLGQKMGAAFQSAFSEGTQHALLVGCDCPGITPLLIEEAFEGLEKGKSVLGPAEDGGYYLLGLNHYIPALFQKKPWGSAQVGSLTLSDLQENGEDVLILPTLPDLDTVEDLRKFPDLARQAGIIW